MLNTWHFSHIWIYKQFVLKKIETILVQTNQLYLTAREGVEVLQNYIQS